MKKILCLILGIVIIISMTGWTTGKIWTPDAFDTEIKSNYSKADKVVASNSKYELKWIGSDCTVDLIEKETGNRWGVTARTPGAPTVDPETGMPIKTLPAVTSTLILEVLDRSNNQTSEFYSAVAAVKNGRVVTEEIENGIRIFFYFDEVKIRAAVDFVLRDNSVAVTMDPKLIQETLDYRLVSAKIAPYWCFNANDTEGDYLFYPSGSGALVNNESTGVAGITLESQVYGFDPSMKRNTLENDKKEVRLPVFGAKTGEIGTAAIIESNPSAGLIGVKAGSTSTKFTAAYAKFQIRSYSENEASQLGNGKVRTNVYTISPGEKPFTVAFYPLSGDKANYSGIAETYKNYLKSKGGLTEKADESPLSVTFVGGVMVNKSFLGMPYKDLVAATTLTDAKDILDELSSATGSKISAKLLGFGSTGVDDGAYAGGMTINKNLGSKKDLSALNSFAGENNIDLYFDFDLIKLTGSSAGFSSLFDTAYNPLLKIAEVTKFFPSSRDRITTTKYSLLSRALLEKGANKVIKKISKWDLSGVSLASLSNMAYSDHSVGTTEYFAKGKMAEDVNTIVGKFSEKYKVAGLEANDYAALISDIIYDTPTTSSRERIFFADVPFYQMVFKGYVAMTSESINMAYDANTHLLKTVESGTGLSYTLISNYENEFIDYIGYYFFGSEYAGIKDDILKNNAALKDFYAAVNGVEIKSHTILDGGLREVVYANGVKVYVNYTDDALTTPDGKTVSACGYAWEK